MPRAYSRAVRKIREPRPIGDGLCELELTLGFVAIIDEADAARVSVCSWCASHNQSKHGPYAKGRPVRGGRFVRLHRFILGFPELLVDHINGDRMDNRRLNLRVATARESNANRRSWASTGLKGVTAQGRFYVAVCDHQLLGTYPTAVAAALAYDAEAIKRFGEFARTNASLGLLEVASAS